MGRHEQREQVFKLLYRVEFHAPEDMPEQIALFRENNEEVPSWQDADAIAARFEKIREKIPELDRLLNENTEGWDTTRMGKVERDKERHGYEKLRAFWARMNGEYVAERSKDDKLAASDSQAARSSAGTAAASDPSDRIIVDREELHRIMGGEEEKPRDPFEPRS